MYPYTRTNKERLFYLRPTPCFDTISTTTLDEEGETRSMQSLTFWPITARWTRRVMMTATNLFLRLPLLLP